jgi:very-short-patch-repair endonuclease
VVAERQHGVIAHWQLLRLGFGASAIQRLVASARLHAIHRGVYAVGHASIGANGRFMAAALAGGETAAVSHRSAAALHGILDDRRAVIDVVTATKRRARSGLRFHRSALSADERTDIDNIPATSLARTLLDIAEVLPRRKLVYALEKAEQLGSFDLVAIEACVARNSGRRGIRPLREAIRDVAPEAEYAHEGLERLFLAFCQHHELQQPAMNAVVEGLTVDALWAKQRVIVELDSWAHHRSNRAFEEDRQRDTILTLAGYRVLRVTDRSLRQRPAQLAALLRSLLDRL